MYAANPGLLMLAPVYPAGHTVQFWLPLLALYELKGHALQASP